MKRFWLIAAIVILAASCVSQPTPSEQDTVDAESAATESMQVRKERIEEIRTPVVVTETVRFADGVIDRVVSYAYDDGYARLLSSTAKKPSSADPIERVAYEYSDGVLASKSSFGPDGMLSTRSEYAYGTGGELVRETIYDGKGLIQSTSEWIWDNGRKSAWRVLSASGLALARTEYFYEGDSIASARLFDGAGNSKGRIEYVYGEGGALVAVRYYDATGAEDGRIEYGQKDGRVVQESVYRADGRLERRLSYEYASDGALVRKTLADSSGKTRETIVYDNAYRTETRTVVYYE